MSSSIRRRSRQFREFPLPSTASFGRSSGDENSLDQGLEAEISRRMADDWHSGRRTPVETWFERYPAACAHSELAVRIIYEEICLREDLGEVVDSSEIYQRFPQWREPMEVLFHCHRLMQGEQLVTRFPV